MTRHQMLTLRMLQVAVEVANDVGLFDELATYTHPDNINAFCDAVADAVEELESKQ